MRSCGTELDTLVEYVEKKLNDSDSTQLESHLEAGCESCQKHIRLLTRISSALTVGDIAHAPADQVKIAMSIFREHYRKPIQIGWLARLVYDSLSSLQPALARGERTASRHRLYKTEEYEIDLWEDPISQQESYLIGQIIPINGRQAAQWKSVHLSSAEGNEIAITQEGSEFHAPAVSPGNYGLTILVDGNVLKVENLSLGV